MKPTIPWCQRFIIVRGKGLQSSVAVTKGAFFWDYSRIGLLRIDGICVLLGGSFGRYLCSVFGMNGISFRSFRMNRMKGIRFARKRQNTRSFGKFLAGNPTRPPARV